MNQDVMRAEVQRIIESIKPGAHSPTQSLADLHFDELDMIEFIVECEEAFAIVIDDEYFRSLSDVPAILMYLMECTEKNRLDQLA